MKPIVRNSFLCILFSLLFVNAFSQSGHIRLNTAKTFSQLPLIATGRLPDMILAGDSIPHAYIRTHIVEVGFTSVVSSNDLIKALQEKGKSEGVDGILLSDLGQNTPAVQVYDNYNNNSSKNVLANAAGNIVTGLVLGTRYGVGFSSIKGIGIKYIDSINYLDAFLKKRNIQVLDQQGNATKEINLRYDINGSLHIDGNTDAKDKFFTDSIMPFDVQMAVNQESNNYEKKFVTDVDSDKPYLSEISGAYGFQNVSYHYKDLQKKTSFKAIVSNENTYDKQKYQIEPNYNTNNDLNGATVTKDGKTLFVISYQLGNKNTVQQENWQKMEDGKLIPWIRISNEYFSNDAYKNGFQ